MLTRLMTAWILLVLILMLGCASYEPANDDASMVAQDLRRNEIVVRDNSLEVGLAPIFQREDAKRWIGIDPVRSGMMPALLTVRNLGPEIVKVDVQASCLVTEDGRQGKGLALDQAIDRALRSDAEVIGWDLMLGPVAMFAAMDHVTSVNRTLEEDYHARCFKPTLINCGQSGAGLVFFDRPEAKDVAFVSAVIVAHRVDSAQTQRIEIALRGGVAE